MKNKKRIEVNISTFLVIGVLFLIWGISFLTDAITKRDNLEKIHKGDIELSDLKEGEYVSVDKVHALGGVLEGMTSYCVTGYTFIEGLTYNYYLVNLNENNNEYISLMILDNQFDELNENIDENGYLSLSDKYDVFNSSFDFKVVETDSKHMSNIRNAEDIVPQYINQNEEVQFCKRVALVPVNFEKERHRLVEAICILFCAFVLILASKPWKVIEIKEIPVKEFNLVYNDERNENDMFVISELARTLRMDIDYYNADLRKLKKNVRNGGIAFLISILIFDIIKESIFDGNLMLMTFALGILSFIPVALLIKFIKHIIILFLNRDTMFCKSVMSIFNREPVMAIIHDRQAKLFRCEAVMNENLNKENKV